MVSKWESGKKCTETPGWFTHKHYRRGPNGQLPCIFDLDQQRPPRTLRDHVQSASALSALKKSLVANLSAKRQLSVAKLSAKRNVSLAKRDFLVANGRMAADFSSPALAFLTLFVLILLHLLGTHRPFSVKLSPSETGCLLLSSLSWRDCLFHEVERLCYDCDLI